jgi:hypothetical protein
LYLKFSCVRQTHSGHRTVSRATLVRTVDNGAVSERSERTNAWSSPANAATERGEVAA